MADEDDRVLARLPTDPAAVGELYDRFYDPIYRYCLRRLFLRELAEDAVSATFLTMVQRIGGFRGKTMRQFQAWLYVIAGNQASQFLREQVRRDRVLKALAAESPPTPDEGRALTWAALYQSLLKLREDQQHLIALRFFQGFSHEEIAQIVGSRAGTVRVRLHRTLEQLRPAFQAAFQEDPEAKEMHHGR